MRSITRVNNPFNTGNPQKRGCSFVFNICKNITNLLWKNIFMQSFIVPEMGGGGVCVNILSIFYRIVSKNQTENTLDCCYEIVFG